jgi:segregation and condensation protein A
LLAARRQEHLEAVPGQEEAWRAAAGTPVGAEPGAPEAPARGASDVPDGAASSVEGAEPETAEEAGEAARRALVAPGPPHPLGVGEPGRAPAYPVEGRQSLSAVPAVDHSVTGGDTGYGNAQVTRAAGADGATETADSGAGEAEVSDGRFTVRLANFEGPFDLLLQLIAKHRLDITEVALSKVTDEFMAHIRAMGPDWDLDQTTEFLVVAATLLDLKAARLLPAAEVEDEADLALLEARDLLFARLLQYRAYKQIAQIFSDRFDAESRRYPRTVGLEPHHAELLPEVVISMGTEGFAELAVKAMQPKPKPQVYVDHIHAPLVSVREQAEVVIARLREVGEASFRQLVEDAPDALTVVARFLALLELYREKAVTLDQEEALGVLLVRWTGGEGGDEPLVTDEFDQVVEEKE